MSLTSQLLFRKFAADQPTPTLSTPGTPGVPVPPPAAGTPPSTGGAIDATGKPLKLDVKPAAGGTPGGSPETPKVDMTPGQNPSLTPKPEGWWEQTKSTLSNGWNSANDWAGKSTDVMGHQVNNGLLAAGGVGSAALLAYLLSRGGRRRGEDD